MQAIVKYCYQDSKALTINDSGYYHDSYMVNIFQIINIMTKRKGTHSCQVLSMSDYPCILIS